MTMRMLLTVKEDVSDCETTGDVGGGGGGGGGKNDEDNLW